MTVEFRDTWPSTMRLLWQLRHHTISERGFAATQRACPSCGHFYTPSHYREHLRSDAHRANRGWWRA